MPSIQCQLRSYHARQLATSSISSRRLCFLVLGEVQQFFKHVCLG